MSGGPAPLRIRGHHLLCMLGFRGMGYSPEFVRNMRRVVDRFFHPGAPAVRAVADCDDICAACPHRRDGRCAAGEDSARRTRCMDLQVLQCIGVDEGTTAGADELMERLARKVSPERRRGICGDCGWADHGVCAEGLIRLKQGCCPPFHSDVSAERA